MRIVESVWFDLIIVGTHNVAMQEHDEQTPVASTEINRVTDDSTASLTAALSDDPRKNKKNQPGISRVASAIPSRPTTASNLKRGEVVIPEPPPMMIKRDKKMEDSAKNKSSTGVAFDNRFIITGSMDGILRIWDCLFDER
jgi:hypothetical protein